MNETSASYTSSRRRTAAVRKIIFETWSHQDYFGAVGDDSGATAAADDNDEERGGEGVQHSITPRLFCDVTINRKIKGKNDARYRTISCWKKRVRRWRQRRRIGNGDDDEDDISDKTDNNDKDARNNCKNNNNTNTTNSHSKKGDDRHDQLISHKPFIISTTSHPRSYHPTYHINTWRWDSSSSSSSFPYANTNTIKPNTNTNTTTPSQQTSLNFPTAQDFLRRIEVGDTIGIWGRVGRGETYHIIDAMRMHVFWAV